jgi:P pilus assembly chaperone PapD
MHFLLMLRLLALAFVTLLSSLASEAVAQGVVVAPHAVYLDHRTRSASLTLYNPGADPAEVMISSLYGYPVTDSVGHFTLFVPDSIDASMPSATDWIEAFPRRMTLAPLQRQTVRLLARPPQGLPDGEYWSRVMISAKGGALQVAGADSAAIQIGLALEVRTIIPLIYRKGVLGTGIAVKDLRAAPVGDSLQVRVRLERQGTAAYIGTAKGALLTSTGAIVATFQQPVAVYYAADPVFTIPLKGQAAGSYRLRLEMTGQRTDIPNELLLKSLPVRDSVEVTIP